MNDHQRAIEILTQAKKILTERLVQWVLESQEVIIDDAHGESYLSEFETIHDRIGTRLSHVNNLLSNMGFDDLDLDSEELADEAEFPEYASTEDLTVALQNSQLALPAPATAVHRETSLHVFATLIQSGETEQAGHLITELFQVSSNRGLKAAEYFEDQFQRNPGVLVKAMGLRRKLATGMINDSLTILWDCFGIQGLESISIIQSLKVRLKPV